jgi:2-haloacid dehalogenase
VDALTARFSSASGGHGLVMPSSPAVVAFDVNETLFSLAPLAEQLPDATLPLWFARVLRDGFALAATNDYATFSELATTHLRGLVDDPKAVLSAFAELDAHPDVRPAFERLRAAGVRIVTLTVGAAELTEQNLQRNGLRGHVERCLSADAVKRWKPHPEPYRHAAAVCGVDPGRMALVAVHSWDTHGAKRAGLTTGWCSRLEGDFVQGFAEPDVSGDDLVEVVTGLLALGGE